MFPEIKMPEYKGIEVEQPEAKVLKKHENEELEKIGSRTQSSWTRKTAKWIPNLW